MKMQVNLQAVGTNAGLRISGFLNDIDDLEDYLLNIAEKEEKM